MPLSHTQPMASASSEMPMILGLILEFLAERGVRDSTYAVDVSRAYLQSLQARQSSAQRVERVRQVPSRGLFGTGPVGKADVIRALVDHVDKALSSVAPLAGPTVEPSPTEVPLVGSDENLFELVVDVLDQFKCNIEATGLWQPFWDEHHAVSEKTSPVACPVPKREPSIQPTILQLLRETFGQHGVAIVRESNEGVGLLDFRCMSTGSDLVYNTCIECKVAHSERIRTGVTRQLPAYMDSVGTSFGVYLVLWFKDAVYWNEPTEYNNCEDLRAAMQSLADEVPSKTIQVMVVDLTRKTPASRRR